MVKALEVKEQIKLREWAMQIQACNESGMPVKWWCAENGIAIKTYYYHVKRVRERMLENLENKSAIKNANTNGDDGNEAVMQTELVVSNRIIPQIQKERPVFAALPIPQQKGAAVAVTVQMGAFAVDIRNGADEVIIEYVLKAVARL